MIQALEVITGLSVGGAEIQLLRRAPYLKEEGVEITVCSFKSGGDLVDSFRSIGVEVIELDSRSLLDPGPGVRLARLLTARSFDVVHCHLFRARLWGVPLARAVGACVLQSEHTLSENHFERRPHTALNRLAGIVLGRLSHLTIAVSRDTARLLRTIHHVPEQRIVHIPNGVAALGAVNAPRAVEDRIRIRAIGRLTEEKGFDVLIEALAMLGDRDLQLCCEIAGAGESRQALEGAISANGLDGVVTLVGVVTDPLRFVAGADIFVMPSRWEAFGIAALEAMACGVPVIASRTGGLTELVRNGVSGILVEPASPATLASAIEELARDRGRRLELRQAGLREARRFDLQQSTRRLAAVYRSVTCHQT